MTKLAILSDIHGNLPALKAVMADLKYFNVDQVIVAGDVVNFGPFSKQTLEIVIENHWPTIRGNNEYFLLDYRTPRAAAEWNDPIRFASLTWLDQQLDQNLKNQVACWPDTLQLRFRDAPPLQVFHGTPQSPWEAIFWTHSDTDLIQILSNVEADFVVCGHTHLPMDRHVDRWRIFNPGSVGVPLDGIFSASYILLEGNEVGWQPIFRRVSFDHETVFKEFETLGHHQTPLGKLFLELHRTARPLFGFFKWREKFRPDDELTLDLVNEFLTTADWREFTFPAYLINLE